jgi:CPA1 family monovalent cation:H+ antiporter
MGAPKKLGIIIEGESLFNDGTAMVIFQLFRELMVGTETTVGGGVAKFVQLAGGGCAVGVVLGFLTAGVIGRSVAYAIF